MAKLPGGAMARRPLHFFFLVDCSGSMATDGKIQALNTAIREAIPHMREAAASNPEAEVLVRVLRFADGAQWHMAQPTPVDQFTWTELTADGVTDLGEALQLLAQELEPPNAPDRGLRPVMVLVSDGQPTDDYTSGLRRLLGTPWGSKAVRIAVAIGRDADFGVLQQFIGHPEYKPLTADNPQALVDRIKWASTAGIKAASRLVLDKTKSWEMPQAPPGDFTGTEIWS